MLSDILVIAENALFYQCGLANLRMYAVLGGRHSAVGGQFVRAASTFYTKYFTLSLIHTAQLGYGHYT